MSKQNHSLVAPNFPQSVGGIIDESEINQDELVIVVERHSNVRIGYQIIVHLTPYLSSIPYPITQENLLSPTYQITIPFFTIPLGSYDVYYTITNLVGNIAISESTHVTIQKTELPKKTDPPQPSLEAILMITGYEPVGYEYEILTIQVYDKQKNELIKNTDFQYKLIQPVNIIDVPEIGSNPDTRYSMTTNEYGEFKINLKGQKFGHCIIQVTINNLVGNVNHTMGEF
ncbi:hypothetical protein [Xenorhabdus sp. BG5]|uniref:hypothetical protein n=1 Tax=Xenorhabdus sp. BG5 TaxID=2782014 RepID=UPI0018810DEE|nr:hypothetical protein [Xenorhabdus sp. BG5]MBE8595163.1 hypothetical protein [Xenorhabdus sp. BG5]